MHYSIFFQRRPHFKFTYVHKTLCRLMHFTLLSYFVKGGLILQKNFNFVLVPKKISLNFRLRSSNKFANHCPLNFELKVKRQWFCTFVWGWNKIEKCVIVIEIKERHGFFLAWNRNQCMMQYVDILTFSPK